MGIVQRRGPGSAPESGGVTGPTRPWWEPAGRRRRRGATLPEVPPAPPAPWAADDDSELENLLPDPAAALIAESIRAGRRSRRKPADGIVADPRIAQSVRRRRLAAQAARVGGARRPDAMTDANAANAPAKFTHLHLHTHYSLLDGANSLDPLFKQTKKLGMNALAVTDHGNLFGAMEFYTGAYANGIKPIIGCEVYIAPKSRHDRDARGLKDAAYHLVLLAKNRAGWQNLIRLASKAYLEGFYYRPRIDKELLAECREGLICLSACLSGEVPLAIRKGDLEGAVATATWFRDTFGEENYFIELQDAGIGEQQRILDDLTDIAERLNIRTVATNDVHFLSREDDKAHEVLLCVNTGKLLADTDRMKFETPENYLKSPDEMRSKFRRWPGALEATQWIADQCNLELDLKSRHAPVYKPETKTADGGPETPEQMLRRLCQEGAARKYGVIREDVQARLDYELKVIEGKGFASYFLIVWDFVNYARSNGILCGARGSGVGCLVAYVLDLHNTDPIAYDLLFERFMDPSRSEMPDIDVDICQEGRQRVIEYVRNKYGSDNVAQIITFNTMAAKAAIRDVGRVMGLPLPVVDKVSKLVPQELKITLDSALEKSAELAQLYESDPQIREMYDLARRLEGLNRNAGMHAAGVVIADAPLINYVPLYKSPDGDVMTQWDMEMVEKAGLLKMDFLGLRTYTMMDRCCRLIKANHGVRVELERLDISDQKVYETVFQKGETKGVFQFESGGMRDVLIKMRPNCIHDLIAAAALYRPGPMELIPAYCDRKHGREQWSTPHPIMDEVLRETYGIMVYQEQVMRIFNRLGNVPLSEAYKLIKAISKKKSDIIEAKKPGFLEGCVKNGVPKDKAEEVFELILKFGGYGFNKSHSTQYAMVAFQTAWLKTYYPVEYMAALLSTEAGNTEKVVEYIAECKSGGVPVMPPDVNESDADFTCVKTPEGRPGIRFGLGAVKGVGDKAVESIVENRKKEGGRFRSLFHFCEAVDAKAANRSTVEALVRCGAFDSITPRRAALLAALDGAMEMGAAAQADRRKGQRSLFGEVEEKSPARAPEPVLPQVPEPPQQDRLKMEKETLGFYVSSHPLADHEGTLKKFCSHALADLPGLADGTPVLLGGLVTAVRAKVAKAGPSAGQKWAILRLEDLTGGVDCLAFADAYAKCRDLIAEDKLVLVKGVVDFKREEPSVRVSEMMPLEEAAPRFCRQVILKLRCVGHDGATLRRLKDIFEAHPGDCPVYFEFLTPDRKRATLRASERIGVLPDKGFVSEIEELLSRENLVLIGSAPNLTAENDRRGGGRPSPAPAPRRALATAAG